jgi:hypothetical protein
MRGGRFGTGMNTFMSVHQQTLEADYATHARQRARATENAMRLAAHRMRSAMDGSQAFTM